MSSDFAAFSALFKSLEAIAVISLQAPFCIPGMTFLTAMPATPSTPHFTLPWFTDPPCDSSTLTFITHPCQGPFLWQLLSAWRLTGWPSPCVFVFCACFLRVLCVANDPAVQRGGCSSLPLSSFQLSTVDCQPCRAPPFASRSRSARIPLNSHDA